MLLERPIFCVFPISWIRVEKRIILNELKSLVCDLFKRHYDETESFTSNLFKDNWFLDFT